MVVHQHQSEQARRQLGVEGGWDFAVWFEQIERRRLAEERGLSLNRVSMEAKVSSPSLYDLIKFRVTPTLRTLTSIARGLGVEAYDLLRPIPEGSTLEPSPDDGRADSGEPTSKDSDAG